MGYSNEKRNNGITLIALIITIIALLVLAGVTAAILTGGDSAPAKANEAKQKNDIGVAQDQIAIMVENARLEAYDDIYVNNNQSVSSSNASTIIGQRVIDDVLAVYGTETTIGDATIKVEQLSSGQSATVLITTRDFEKEGIIKINGGTLIWEFDAYTMGQKVMLGGEEFWVIEDSDKDKSTVKLLAKLNVQTTPGEGQYTQSVNANSLAFDSTSPYSNVYEDSTIITEVENYKAAVEERMGAGRTIQEARLLTGTATGNFNYQTHIWSYTSCSGEIGALLSANKSNIIYGTSYWLGTPDNNTYDYENCVYTSGNYAYRKDSEIFVAFGVNYIGRNSVSTSEGQSVCGLRPVFVVQKTNI